MVFLEMVSMGNGFAFHWIGSHFIQVSNGFQGYGLYNFSYGHIGYLVSIGV
jgi:hypothetical protein